jgi:hypothetical protein
MAKEPNAYLLAIFTALLAAGGAMIGTCYQAKWQASLAAQEREASCRREVYTGFLTRISRTSDSTASEFLNVGALADRVETDEQVQALEERIGRLQSRVDPQELYLRLNSDLNLLRMCASPAVRRQTDDLLSVLLSDFSAVHLDQYSADFRRYFGRWDNVGRNGAGYAIEERVSSDERTVIILASGVLQQLIRTMNSELAAESK